MTNNQDKYVEKLRLYQSANTDATSIKESFVIRVEEYELITNTLKKRTKKSAFQHELILGRRGSGKSTLLRRIEIGIKEDVTLKKQYFPILFAEEQANIYRLSDLWYETLKELSAHLDLYLELNPFSDYDDESQYARYLFQEIVKLTEEHNTYPVLLLDNFDKLIGSLGDKTNLLREQLLNYDAVKLIGASTRMDEQFWNYKVPFYDFFRLHNLGPLSLVEIDTLFSLWGELMDLPLLHNYVEKHRGKIEAIRILTDGLPRTLQFFIRILISKDVQYGFDYIKMIMDQVTPIYQERLNLLTAPQRKIFAEMAFIWEACPTKSLVEVCRMESKVVSAQLKKLIDFGFVEKKETNTKNHLYRISERFFNMWYIVTQGNPAQKRKARYLTLFLESWYDKEEINRLAEDHLSTLEEGVVPYNKAAVSTKALSQSRYISTLLRDKLIEQTMSLPDSINTENLPKKSKEIFERIIKAVNQNKFEKAIAIVDEIENEEDGRKHSIKGFCHRQLKQFDLAEKYYLLAIEKGDDKAANNLAILYKNQQKFDLAEKYYLLAIEKDDDKAPNNLINLYFGQNKKNKARQIVSKFEDIALNKGFDIIIDIWLGKFENIEKRITQLILNKEFESQVSLLLSSLLHLSQAQLVLKQFAHPEYGQRLSDEYVVIYYATLILTGEGGKLLELKIPEEIKPTVDAFVQEVKDRMDFYNS